MRQQKSGSDVAKLHRSSPKELLGTVDLILQLIARCDRDDIAIPPDFLAHFGTVRNVLMKKCVGTDYTESEFCKFFGAMLKCAGEEYGAAPARMETLQAMNQLTQ